MKVFKFGGASVKDTDSIRNLNDIISKYRGENLVIVVSAMGKVTHALENLADIYCKRWSKEFQKVSFEKLISNPETIDNQRLLKADFSTFETSFKAIYSYHFTIVKSLFPESKSLIYNELNHIFEHLFHLLENEPSGNYDFDYDQIVSLGEVISTLIVSTCLNEVGIKSKWIDVRKVLKTDNNYRDAKVDWTISQKNARKIFSFSDSQIYVTQGFIGSTPENFSITLGKEGSDYSAAILAYFLDAEQVTIWKDVDGIYNADPKLYANPQKLPKISYKEAIELTYFGAKVIHPKTIRPLQNKNIALVVKSFLNPDIEGSIIANFTENDLHYTCKIPIYIIKKNQILISISPKDFSFIAEDNLSTIFQYFSNYHIRVNLMQTSAISFSACVDFHDKKIPSVLEDLHQEFKVLYNTDLELITIQNYSEESIHEMTTNKQILVEQRSRNTVRFVVK